MLDFGRRLRWAVALGALLAVPALAEPPEHAPGDDRPHFGRRGPPPIDAVMERHADELGLDEATRAAIEEIAAESRLAEAPIREELHEFHEAMRSLLDADSPELDDVMQWAERIGAAETELKKLRLRTMLEVRALLSPEQRQKLVKIFEERKARRKRWRDESRNAPAEQETPQ